MSRLVKITLRVKSGEKSQTVPQNLTKIACLTSKVESNNDSLGFDEWNLSKASWESNSEQRIWITNYYGIRRLML